MKNTKRCSLCVLSSNFPNISFDEQGVCSFCRNKLFQLTEDDAINKAGNDIDKLFHNVKGGNHQYDAIMCYSGGKDSTYTLKIAVEKYKLNVLAFTLDNGFISPVAFDNINKVVNSLGVDHVVYKPSSNYMKKLFRVSALNALYSQKTLCRISSVCNSCISMVNMAALRMAYEKNIKIILAGFTLGQIPSNAILYKNSYSFLKESRRGLNEKLARLVGKESDKYFSIDDVVIKGKKETPINVNLLCLEDISDDDIVEGIIPLGWEHPKDVDGCSSNCQLNAFNNYIHQESLGYNPYELELSHLIRKGKMSRVEALNKLTSQPEDKISYAIKSLSITKEELKKVARVYRL